MKPINDLSDWWSNVDEHWDDLTNIIRMFCPISSFGLAALAELKIQRDPGLWWYFQQAWMNAPDDRSIHSIPSWYVLCDLCSENWVFDYKDA